QALGLSCDWDRLRFTMDEGLVRAVRVAFVRLYEEGLIYRGERIINWCPQDTTALSDSEVEYEETEGELVTFRYDLSDGSGHVDVATTRIETMLGDTAVAVHPSDDRYAAVVGKTVRHPFTGEDLPIVADEVVDPAFGTGAVAGGQAMVRGGRPPQGSGEAGRARRTGAVQAGAMAAPVRPVARQPAGLEHLSPALVGPSDPRVVLPERPSVRQCRGPH